MARFQGEEKREEEEESRGQRCHHRRYHPAKRRKLSPPGSFEISDLNNNGGHDNNGLEAEFAILKSLIPGTAGKEEISEVRRSVCDTRHEPRDQNEDLCVCVCVCVYNTHTIDGRYQIVRVYKRGQ